MTEQKSKRRYLRFSLRSLLILMTVTAIWLGLFLNRVRQQAAAVAMIERLGGRCWYSYQVDENRISHTTPQEPNAPLWLRKLLGDHFFTSVLMVNLKEKNFTDRDIELLVNLRNLKRLDLDGPAVTDESLTHIGKITSLEDLNLFDTLVTDDGLKHLADLKQLTVVTLTVSRISDLGFAHLRNFKSLERLYVSHNDITDDALKALRGIDSLKEVQAYSTQVTQAGAQQFLPDVQVGTGRAAVASPLRSRP